MNRRGFFGRLLGGVAVALGAKLAPKAYEVLVEIGPAFETPAAAQAAATAAIASASGHFDMPASALRERQLAAYRELEADLHERLAMPFQPPVMVHKDMADRYFDMLKPRARFRSDWIPFDANQAQRGLPMPVNRFEERWYPELRSVISQRDEMNRLILQHINTRTPEPYFVPAEHNPWQAAAEARVVINRTAHLRRQIADLQRSHVHPTIDAMDEV